MSYLADTNVIGDLARPRPNPGVLTWAGQIRSVSLSKHGLTLVTRDQTDFEGCGITVLNPFS